MYIFQNAIEIIHNGNSIILNSRICNSIQSYTYKNSTIYINGGKIKFDGIYKSIGNFYIKDLRLTYDSTINDFKEKLLWADMKHEGNSNYFKWEFAKNLSKQKLEMILEEGINSMHPYIYKVIKYIYNSK